MNELNMIRVLLDEAPPSAEVIAEGRRRVAASATEVIAEGRRRVAASGTDPGRPAALRGAAGHQTRPATDLRPARDLGSPHRLARGAGSRHRLARGPESRRRSARRISVGAAVVGAAAALALVTLVPHGAHAARSSHGQADELPGRPARGFLLTMAVKAAAGGQSTGRWYCSQKEQGGRVLVGPDDTTLQAPWGGGPPLAGYRYALFTKFMIESCFEPPRKGAPDGTVEAATQALGAQPASPADAAAWRRAGSPTSWIAWYDKTVRITMAPGRRYLAGPRNLWGANVLNDTLPANPAQLRAFILAHQAEFHNAGTQSEILYDDTLAIMDSQSAPAVRAAAYRLLASLPGIQMKPNVQDPAGQSGTAVWLSQAGPTLGLTILDPATGKWLCTEDVAQQPVAHAPAGTVLDYTLFVSSGWTNTPPSS
jgi:hypothetical protein